MITNDIEVPESSHTVDYIADPVGGWMYTVEHIVQVTQRKLEDFQKDLDDAKAQRDAVNTLIAKMEPQAKALQDAMEAVPAVKA